MRRTAPTRSSLPLLLLTLFLAGCSADAPEDAAPEAAAMEAAEPEVMAAAVIDPALFDSIAWTGPSDAMKRGATVYMYSCAKCHGDRGAGDAQYQLRGRVLRPPSLRAPDWRFSDDLSGLREAIYAGNEKGMPHWGNAGLAARDIDAVAQYILLGLRANVE